jgi:hypothetical protein
MKTAKKAVRKQKSIPPQLTEAAIDAFELSKSGSPLDSRLREEGIHEGLRATSRKRVSGRRTIESPTPDNLVALSSLETRRALSPSALRGFFDIAREWRLDDNQMRVLVGGIAPSTLHVWRRSPDKRALSQDVITRISLLVGIYKALHTYFGDPGDHWITTPNDSPLFGGVVPIDFMLRTGVTGMYEVRKMLDAWAAGH